MLQDQVLTERMEHPADVDSRQIKGRFRRFSARRSDKK
jgi:hypothetical protein